MLKFSGTKRRPLRANLTAPIRTLRRRTFTHEGGEAYVRDAEPDLFLLEATNMAGENTFYERAADRDARFVNLVDEVTESNPAFIAGATRTPARSAWPSTCGGRCSCGRPPWSWPPSTWPQVAPAVVPWWRAPSSRPTSRPSCSATG